jgi:hypothetical protein
LILPKLEELFAIVIGVPIEFIALTSTSSMLVLALAAALPDPLAHRIVPLSTESSWVARGRHTTQNTRRRRGGYGIRKVGEIAI